MLHNSNQAEQGRGEVRVSRYIATILHTALWAVLAATLLLRTAPDLYRDVRVSRIGPIDPNRSIGPYFRGLTGIANGPQHLGDILEYPVQVGPRFEVVGNKLDSSYDKRG